MLGRLPLLGALLAALCLPTSLASASPAVGRLPAPIVPEGFGVNIHFTHFAPDELKLFKDAGFGFVRMDFHWDSIERTAGVYDFSSYDQLLSDLDSAGARALLILDYGNPLYDQGASPHTDAGRAAFARFAAAAASHFAGRGVVWEIWNEPNIGFWKPKPSVADYAALVKATVAEMRKTDPRALILAGATSQLPANYIEPLLRSGAMARVDALSVHPYRGDNPETVAEDYNRTRALIARFTTPGQPVLPIVCSEWGYATNTKGISEKKQAAYIVREYLSNLIDGVNLTIFYDWKNDGPDASYNEHRFGTLTQDLTPKPSYLAAQSFIASLRGYRFAHRLTTDDPSRYRALFAGPSDLAVVEWSSTDNGPDARLPVVHKIAPGSPEYADLRRIASIEFAPDTRVTLINPTVPFRVRITNPDDAAATVMLKNRERLCKVVLSPHETQTAMTSAFVDASVFGPQPIDLSVTWNGAVLSGFELPSAVVASVFDLTVGPIGGDLAARVTNTLDTPFAGRVVLAPSRGGPISAPLSLATGETRTVTLPGGASLAGLVQVVDRPGFVWAREKTDRYIAKAGWPAAAGQQAPYSRVFYLENKLVGKQSVDVVPTEAGSPAPVALSFTYECGNDWRYYTLEPLGDDPIPAGATSMSLWMFGDGGGAQVRARFHDETGQTFQPDGGKVDKTGWFPVTLRLDGRDTAHWGGANDGVPHGQLRWSGLVLLDGSHLADHVGKVLVASPMYAMP